MASFQLVSIPCSKCGAELEQHGDLTHVGWVNEGADPEGEARLDLILECEACSTRFNAFVSLADFMEID